MSRDTDRSELEVRRHQYLSKQARDLAKRENENRPGPLARAIGLRRRFAEKLHSLFTKKD